MSNGAPSDYGRLVARVDALERDMWRGNGKPGMTTRMQQVEDVQRGYEDILPKMRAFLQVQEYRDGESKNAWWKTALGAGLVLFVFNVLWSIVKSKLGLG